MFVVVACWLLFDDCCTLCAACCSLCDVCCLLLAVGLFVLAGYRLLFAVGCSLLVCVVCRLVFAMYRRSLCSVGLLFVVC